MPCPRHLRARQHTIVRTTQPKAARERARTPAAGVADADVQHAVGAEQQQQKRAAAHLQWHRDSEQDEQNQRAQRKDLRQRFERREEPAAAAEVRERSAQRETGA